MSATVIIPARYASSRFPGKPLHVIKGKSLLERVWQIAKSAKGVNEVIIATDDSRILAHAQTFGAQAVMTDSSCQNGTERVADAIVKLRLDPQIIVNLQGDTPLTPPWVIERLVSAMQASPTSLIATPAQRLSLKDYEAAKISSREKVVSGTYVVLDKNMDALYFSRWPVPFLREVPTGSLPFFKHIGIYGFRPEGLKQYLLLPMSPLEQAEGLEQLRALEAGMKIRVVEVDCQGRTLRSVDKPEDAVAVAAVIEAEGELIS